MTHLCGDKESAAVYYEVIIYSQLLVNIPVAVCVVWGTHLISRCIVTVTLQLVEHFCIALADGGFQILKIVCLQWPEVQ